MKPLHLLSRLLTQRWAMRPETHSAIIQSLLAGETPKRETLAVPCLRPQADTSFNVAQWDSATQSVVRKPMPMSAGYTAFNYEGLFADLRGALPPAPPNTSVMLIWGPVGRGWTMEDRWWLDAVDVDEVIRAVSATPEGSTVVLWFRSPGGIVTGIPEAAAELRRLGQTRRIVSFTDDLCASASYWMASQTSSIVSTPTADVGSIGVYLAFYDYTGMLEKAGIKLELFREGTLKGTGVMGNPLDEAARGHLQSGVTDAYQQFTTAVTDMRAVAPGHMQGQCLSGQNAMAANLVDGFAPSSTSFYMALSAGRT